MNPQPLIIAGVTFSSRLFVGTGKYSSGEVMRASLAATGTQLVTVALRRGRTDGTADDIIGHLETERYRLLPNTSGVRDAKEAVLAAELAREALETNWLKLEIHPDPKYLMPDPIETLAATRELVKRGFLAEPHVLPMEATVSLQEIVGDNAVEERYRVRWHDLHPQSRRRLAHLLSPIAVERYGQLSRHGHDRRAPPKKAIVFCVDTDHADTICKQFRDQDHLAAAVHSKSAGRAEALRRFQLPGGDANRFDVLTTVNLLTEGVDLPSTEIVVMLRPTLSRILFQQMVGRCLRGPEVTGGKKDAYILDLALNTDEFPNWMSAEELFGVDDGARTKRRVAARRLDAEDVQPVEYELEADVATWLVEFLDVSIVGRTLAGWYEIPDPDDEGRHSLLAVFDDDRNRYRQWAQALLQSAEAPEPDALPDGWAFRTGVLMLGAEPPFHLMGESRTLALRVAEMAAQRVAFGGAGLLRDRLREALVHARQRYGLDGDGGTASWRAALRVLDRRMTEDFLKAVRP